MFRSAQEKFLLACLFFVSISHFAFAVDAPQSCDRACLRNVTNQYLKALLAHNPALAPMDSKVRYTENAAVVANGDGLWKTVASLRDHQQFYQDAVTGNALFRGVVNETGVDSAAIVAIRIKAPAGKITEVETIIARKGSHSTYTPDALTAVDPLLTQVVPAAQRATREQLKAIADSYWVGIEHHDRTLVSYQKGCDRIENGRKMTNNSAPGASAAVQADCGSGANSLLQIRAVPERRYYLLDEERGIAIGTFILDVPPTPAKAATAASGDTPAKAAATATEGRMPLICEVFKIADGKIQYIEATLLNMPYDEQGAKSGW